MLVLDRTSPAVALPLAALSLQSTIAELNLHDFQLEASCSGSDVAIALEQEPLLPGVILTDSGNFLGMISRRQFSAQMSRPYGLELFSKRSVKRLYEFTQSEHLTLPGDTLIVQAAQQSLQRSPEQLYEPIVVRLANQQFRLLDVHQLLLAQSQIHVLTTQLLEEQTQAKLVQAEKMSALGQMVASVAHDILNPVNFICGNVKHLANYGQDLLQIISTYESTSCADAIEIKALQDEIDLAFIQQDFPQVISSIKLGAERLRKTISALRNFSHMDEATKKATNLQECLEDTLLILQGRIKYKIEVIRKYGELPLIHCYPGQLGQVLMNLISNAIDALLDLADTNSDPSWQPKIEITTARVSDRPNWILIKIADNGPGIAPEIQARVFESFFTTKPIGKGTGLGLAISYQIVVEKHQGEITFSSQPGVGTQFELLLPIA